MAVVFYIQWGKHKSRASFTNMKLAHSWAQSNLKPPGRSLPHYQILAKVVSQSVFNELKNDEAEYANE